MKKSDAAKRQGLKSMSKRRSGEKSSKRLGKIIPRDSKNEPVATTIKIVIATAPFFWCHRSRCTHAHAEQSSCRLTDARIRSVPSIISSALQAN